MKITEEIKLTTTDYGPVSRHEREYSLSGKSIDDFIAKLGEHGVVINPEESEKTVKYYLKNEKRTTVPLKTEFPEDVRPRVENYLLRAADLELELQDYSQCGRSNRIGGSVSGEYGITCKVTAEGRNVDASIVEKVREALDETYIPPVVLSEEEKEQLRKFEEQIADELKQQRKKKK